MIDTTSINKVIEMIVKNYGIHFVIEKTVFDDAFTVYRLKRRREIRVFFISKPKVFFEYETNEINTRMNFDSIDEAEKYLRLRYSEPEGFITSICDVS